MSIQFLKSWAQEHNLQCQTVSKNMLWGGTFKAFKTSGNWSYLIKRPSGQQGVKIIEFKTYYIVVSLLFYAVCYNLGIANLLCLKASDLEHFK